MFIYAILERMELFKISQRMLAVKLGTSRQRINRMLKNSALWSAIEMIIAAQWLGLDLNKITATERGEVTTYYKAQKGVQLSLFDDADFM